MKYDNAWLQIHDFFFQRTDIEEWMMTTILAGKKSLLSVLLQQVSKYLSMISYFEDGLSRQSAALTLIVKQQQHTSKTTWSPLNTIKYTYMAKTINLHEQ